MSRSRRKPSAVSLQLPNSPLTIKLDSSAPLTVQLAEPPKPTTHPRRLTQLFFLFVLVLFVTLAFASIFAAALVKIIYFYPPASTKQGFGPMTVAVAHPRHIAYGDENELLITIFNHSPAEADTTVAVVFSGTATARPLPSDATTIKLDKLPRGASVTHRLKFDLLAPAVGSDAVTIALAAREWGELPVAQMPIAPLRYANTAADMVLNRNNFFAIFAAIIALLWEAFRKRLLGQSDK